MGPVRINELALSFSKMKLMAYINNRWLNVTENRHNLWSHGDQAVQEGCLHASLFLPAKFPCLKIYVLSEYDIDKLARFIYFYHLFSLTILWHINFILIFFNFNFTWDFELYRKKNGFNKIFIEGK